MLLFHMTVFVQRWPVPILNYNERIAGSRCVMVIQDWAEVLHELLVGVHIRIVCGVLSNVFQADF